MQKRVLVAVGVIIKDHNVLLAKRHEHLHQGGKWEFPGGKVEANETASTALCRELKEEVGIIVENASPLISISYDYPDKQVLLDVFNVTSFSGEPYGVENQLVEWVPINQLTKYNFPDANKLIIEKILMLYN